MAVDDSYTKSLLHFDGSDASTTFTDESGKTWTAYGNAQIDTAQSKFGGASGLFDGTGDYITSPDSADLYFDGDFTIDFWVRFNSLPSSGAYMSFYAQRVDGNNQLFFGINNTSGTYKGRFYNQTGGTLTIDLFENLSGTTSTNTWYHIAIIRSGNDFKLFKDGVQCGSTLTDSSPVTDFGASVYVGVFGSSFYLNGWVDEFRISKGVARWTANFTPPTAAYGLSNTGFFF